MTRAWVDSPYKFLDYYRKADRGVFFGREREAQILLSEVVVGRLVVLFAKTGTGKTSLINAGVRPLLEERGFATVFVRVSRDPATSAKDALREAGVDVEELDSLAAELKAIALRLRQPIALFFDQFEEFFIYRVRDAPEAAHQFIEDLADLYHDRDAGIHVVLSLREDFFVELDMFRDDIPTIFHNDSNLRLSWFDEEQALAAIIRPAEARGVQVESGLAERIIDDLATDGLVEPAQLQIVCDTLWRARAGPRIARADYDALGGRERNVARQILGRRLEEEFERIHSRQQLELLERLLPALRTQRGTKYVRDVDGLLEELGVSVEQLEPVLHSLEQPRLLSRHVRGDVEFVELTHDYLVGQLDDLRARVSTIWPRRILREAMEWYRRTGSYPVQSDDLEDVLVRVQQDWKAQQARKGGQPAPPGRDALHLDRDEAGFLFGFAVHRGVDPAVMLDVAVSVGVPVWDQLRDSLRGDLPAASNVVDLLIDRRSPEALTLLEEAWEHPQFAARAVEGLGTGQPQTRPVVDLLARALLQERLALHARQALINLAGSKKDPRVANRAAMVLLRHLRQALDDGTLTPSAAQELGRVEKRATVELLRSMLADEDYAAAAQEALLTLARAPKTSVASRAQAALLTHFDEARRRGRLSEQAIRALGRIEDAAAIELLERIATDSESRQPAKLAMADLVKSRDARVSERAQLALTGTTPGVQPPEPVSPQPARSEGMAPASFELEPHFQNVVRATLDGRLIPVLGAGVNLSGRPPDTGWQFGQHDYLPSGAELAAYLARYFDYPADDESLTKDLVRVAQYVAVMAGPGPLYERLREVFDADYEPSPVHRLFARLPKLLRQLGAPHQLILTTNYDDVLERALRNVGEEFDVVSYIAEGEFRGKFLHLRPDGEVILIETPNQYGLHGELSLEQRPVVLKLMGGVDRVDEDRDSFIITEDHYIEYLTRTEFAELVPIALTAKLKRSHFLFLGYSMRDWNLRVILDRIWGRQRLKYYSWAVQLDPEPTEREYWSMRGVEILNQHLDAYVDALTAYFGDAESNGNKS